MKNAALGLLFLTILCACAASSPPNAAPDVNPATVNLDPVAAAPHIYSVRIENEYVRAIETRARPGEYTPLHSHPGRAVVFLNDCIELKVDDEGMASDRVFKAGDVLWAPAETHGDFRYRFTDECRIVEVEVKAAN